MPFAGSQQQDWQPPMIIPDGFIIAEEGFPVIEASVNDSVAATSGQASPASAASQGENEEEHPANGASGPTSPNKKDQEYRSLLPSDESQDLGVVEDVTVTVVKGNVVKPVASSDDQTGDGVSEDYVFLITDPQ